MQSEDWENGITEEEREDAKIELGIEDVARLDELLIQRQKERALLNPAIFGRLCRLTLDRNPHLAKRLQHKPDELMDFVDALRSRIAAMGLPVNINVLSKGKNFA